MKKLFCLLGAILLLHTGAALAASAEDEIRAAAMAWIEGISLGDADYMASLYAEDAILHGTVSPVLREGTDLIREYFAATADNPPNMFFVEPMRIRLFGDTAVNTGNYGVRFAPAQEPILMRYSFVYHRFPEGWLIVDHHSSRMPEGNP